ncbi:uncharacterized protein BYT42DRAFT_65712 [Radiomyces spectabilis]|uniref:uncharacterized protein n=1 Tax=Radiomyces spectabilis TaxID=64574 RepID=UPI0022200906|nr:uncharacterized protein BYT42DRAFT_65712 [Radiomyces spectabilis]KAI8371376.1 hypothetical protein BYT42DRAFT_65712 [Radiomyces spectabilis]
MQKVSSPLHKKGYFFSLPNFFPSSVPLVIRFSLAFHLFPIHSSFFSHSLAFLSLKPNFFCGYGKQATIQTFPGAAGICRLFPSRCHGMMFNRKNARRSHWHVMFFSAYHSFSVFFISVVVVVPFCFSTF